MTKLLTANLTYNGDGDWNCEVKDHVSGELCLPGLENALDTEFDTLNKYQLRVYDKAPRCETTKLYLSLEDSAEQIVGEDDVRYGIDCVLGDLLERTLRHVEVAVDDPEDEDSEEFKVFYIRVIDKGLVEQVPCDADYDQDTNELTIYSESDCEAVIKIDMSNLKWVACT